MRKNRKKYKKKDNNKDERETKEIKDSDLEMRIKFFCKFVFFIMNDNYCYNFHIMFSHNYHMFHYMMNK